MKLYSILTVAATTISSVAAQGSTITVPAQWSVSQISISNIRHGTGGYWSLNVGDFYSPKTQGFNTTCSYNNPTTYTFALDGAPYNAPCANPNVTFGLFPSVPGETFTLNITHKYMGACGGKKNAPCVDNGTWHFSWDDVRGQQQDAENNFGQAGGFSRSYLSMYPKRAIPSSRCEFC